MSRGGDLFRAYRKLVRSIAAYTTNAPSHTPLRMGMPLPNPQNGARGGTTSASAARQRGGRNRNPATSAMCVVMSSAKAATITISTQSVTPST